jgi:hypothetical protein
MATDNVLRVYPCPVQLCDDALLRPGVPDRERWRHWSAPVDLFHVGFLRSCCVIVRPRVVESSLPLYVPMAHFKN